MSLPAASQYNVHTDLVIFGGGIAGLWLLDKLKGAGYQVVLLESAALGQGQSIASQGIIHGGLKYALGGSVTGASNAIAEMPARWSACLKNEGDVDLSPCQVLSESCYMWSNAGVRSRLKTFLGSKSLQGRVKSVSKTAYPALFADATARGLLYELPDFVIDTHSLLYTLSQRHSDSILKISGDDCRIEPGHAGEAASVRVVNAGQSVHIKTGHIVFSAGEGNQHLMQLAGYPASLMQTRPLHMVMLKQKNLPAAFVHCIGDSFSLTPKLTLTTHRCKDGASVWYMGGELAESGVDKSSPAQIDAAKVLVTNLFPWLDFHQAEWASFIVNRAEGRAQGQHRPDSVFLQTHGNCLLAWPTKFTLSPALADALLLELQSQGFTSSNIYHPLPIDLSMKPAVAIAPWESHF